MINIYLAGGFHTNWQETIVKKFTQSKSITFFNPREHGFKKSDEYYFWDTLHLEKSDIVLAYLERTNPLALGLIFELGYARGLRKKVILIDGKTKHDSEYAKQFRFAKESVDIIFHDLDTAINYIESFESL